LQGLQGLPGPIGPQGPQGPQGLPGTQALFGSGTNFGAAGRGRDCTLGEIILTAGGVVNGVPANGQLLPINVYTALFSLLGTTYGGDGRTTFALPNLAAAAPNLLTYSICTEGIYPSRQ
jgi:microcystin-dependent protein